MTRYIGSLLGSIDTYLAGKSNRKFGALVIDEYSPENELSDRTVAQRQALIFARERGFKIILIELNPAMTWEKRNATNSNLTDILPPGTEVFFKKGFNAFGRVDDTGKSVPHNIGRSLLDESLRKAGVNELLIMGQMSKMCVNRTALGGQEGGGQTGPPTDGAVQFGYEVWFCPQIINAGKYVTQDPDWYETKGVKCYSEL